MEKFKLVSPWVNYYNEVKALFYGFDPEVSVKLDDENYELKIYVEDPRKAEAIQYILPQEKIFGNVSLKITVIPVNKPIDSIEEALNSAFRGNPVFMGTRTKSTMFGDFNYALFTPDVIQYHNDDINDVGGKRTTVFEEVAKDVLSLGADWHICSPSKLFSRFCQIDDDELC